MAFEWDAAKNGANIERHGIDFDDAIRIFDGPTLQKIDLRQDCGEVRVIAFGEIDDRELAVVYTVRGGRRRIISARRAHRRERKAYREAFPKRSSTR